MRLSAVLLIALLAAMPILSYPSTSQLIVTDWYGRPLSGAIVYAPGVGNLTADAGGRVLLPLPKMLCISLVYTVYYDTPIGAIVEHVKPVMVNGTLRLRLRSRLTHILMQHVAGSMPVNASLWIGSLVLARGNGTLNLYSPSLIYRNGEEIPVPLEAKIAWMNINISLPLPSGQPDLRIPVYAGGGVIIAGVELPSSPRLIGASNYFYRCAILGDSYYGGLTLFFQNSSVNLSLTKGIVEGRLEFLGNLEREGNGRFTVYYPLKNCVYGYVVKPGEKVFLELRASTGNISSYYKVLAEVPYHGTTSRSNSMPVELGGVEASESSVTSGFTEIRGGSSSDPTVLISVSAAVIASIAAAFTLLFRGEGEEHED